MPRWHDATAAAPVGSLGEVLVGVLAVELEPVWVDGVELVAALEPEEPLEELELPQPASSAAAASTGSSEA
ncbi:MAG TPA: hypothetical protein VGI27_09275 [Solirubrobacteraceae bacterium]|jgi:hypothetical protein